METYKGTDKGFTCWVKLLIKMKLQKNSIRLAESYCFTKANT